MRRTLPPLVALATIALIGAGCGSSASSESGSAKTAGDRDQAVKFAACMRRNGVPHFPDPDAKGDFNFGVDVSEAVFTRAVDACKALQPPGSLSAKRTPEEQSASLRLAQCIRDHGVKDFPDPVNGEPVVDTTKIPSTNTQNGMTVLNAAMQACRGILDQAVGGQR